MSIGTAIMYLVAGVLFVVGLVLLVRLRSPSITEGRTYAYRMVGTMLVAGGFVLAASATALWRWSVTP